MRPRLEVTAANAPQLAEQLHGLLVDAVRVIAREEGFSPTDLAKAERCVFEHVCRLSPTELVERFHRLARIEDSRA